MTSFLPRLKSGRVVCYLPLLESTAGQLMQLAITDWHDPTSEELKSSLLSDPAFLVWAICVDPQGIGGPSTEAMIDWLRAGNLTSHLQWSSDQLSKQRRVTQSLQNQWNKLTQQSARLVKRIANRQVKEGNVETWLLAQVHNADDWIRVGIGGRCSNATVDSILPQWWIHLMRQDHPQSSPAAVIQRSARSIQGQRGNQNASIKRENRRDLQTEFTTERPAATLLPRLMERLNRLYQLEGNFNNQLQHEKLLAMKELAYGASHVINNPLANISSRAQILLKEEADPERRRKLATINAQAFRAYEMIADMMLFAKPPPVERKDIALTNLMDEVRQQVSFMAEEQGTKIVLLGVAPCYIRADPVQLKVALMALVKNSLEALGDGGEIRVGASITKHERFGDAVQLVIEDTGPGISSEARRHLFDPFYSGREAGRGLGFGLAKACRIAHQHQGEIKVDEEYTEGARLEIYLPLRIDK